MKQAGVRASMAGHTGTINHSFQTRSLAETKTRNGRTLPLTREREKERERERELQAWWRTMRVKVIPVTRNLFPRTKTPREPECQPRFIDFTTFSGHVE